MTDDLLPRLQAAFAGTLPERLGIELLEAAPGRVVGRMPVAGNTTPAGLLHGGASAALAETLGSLAATVHAGPGRAAVGIEVSASHHRGARAGHVVGTASALHEGGRIASYEIQVLDDDGQRICTARLTCMLIDTGGGSRIRHDDKHV
ncbi:PaaI family thioesterase [Georgenia yuyongxinii]|uniref:PaaI family thioesterase n=1 Tax=Georgenia yuyongxinii TaxID=2589797 RepID=A0A5B8C2D4_9MICO|nr:PaaI family thioesterase [Georgenia yuyongxinii]QDC24498.1 PaaI family thioesterase [Georgenia yuyongxinii]